MLIISKKYTKERKSEMDNNKKDFKPYIPADKVVPEFTVTALLIGILLAIVFGAANAYLGLLVGMTVSASIPAAVISMGIIRVILRKDSILENNMVQTIGSAGESVAAGAIFTLPALFLWAEEGKIDFPSILTIFLIALFGGVLGVCFMVPLRQALIVEEHGTLPFPEGTACAEVLLAGEEGGSKAGTVFAGLGIAAVYKFLADGTQLFKSEIGHAFESYKGSQVGIQVLPALAGVGYICGPKISSYMFAGGTLSWFVLMPMIALFGADATIFPASKTVTELLTMEGGGPSALWSNYIKYIGAGAVATGGIISLIKSLPLIIRTFKQAIDSMKNKNAAHKGLRTEQDLPIPVLIAVALVIAVLIWLIPTFPVNLIGALIIVVFGFFFATVSSRMVGLIGSSNNPVSGMTIATLLFATVILKATGTTGITGMVGAISIGGIICIVAAIAGDASQDLKTGFIVGATPKKQQLGEIIGVVASAAAIGFVLYLLNEAWGYGTEKIPAAQATMMKMHGELPWALIFIGVFIAIVVEILHMPVMPFAVGMYLPFSLSAGIMAGGVVRILVEKRKGTEKEKKARTDRGLLFTSGMIAGEGIVGILLAVFAVFKIDSKIVLPFQLPQIGSLILFIALLALLYRVCMKADKE